MVESDSMSAFLKIFGLLKSVTQAALKCPKPLFSISLFKNSSALQSIEMSDLKNHLFFDRKVRFKKFLVF